MEGLELLLPAIQGRVARRLWGGSLHAVLRTSSESVSQTVKLIDHVLCGKVLPLMPERGSHHISVTEDHWICLKAVLGWV